MDRRDFIKLTAVTGTTATLAGCGNPEHQIIRFVPDDDLVPGVAEWKPSVCPLCSAGCGVTARVMEADVETVRNGQSGVVKMGVAKKLEGQADSPINHGGLCARGQAAIQITYHPDRLTQPMKRSGARGSVTSSRCRGTRRSRSSSRIWTRSRRPVIRRRSRTSRGPGQAAAWRWPRNSWSDSARRHRTGSSRSMTGSFVLPTR